ncbi:hypothetical protein [Lysobacter terrae]
MTATSFGAVSLDLPALVCLNGYFSADQEVGLRAAGLNFLSEEIMVCKEYFRSEIPGWIVELNGSFREFVPTGKRRAWARPLSFLWRFTLSEYRVSPPQKITVGELREKVRGIKEDRKVLAHLKNYLSQFDERELVTQSLLQKWPI